MTLMTDEKQEDEMDMKSKIATDEKFRPAQTYQFKASVNSEFGFSELAGSASKRRDKSIDRLSHNDLIKGGRKVLAERENIHVELNEISSKSQSSASNMSNKENVDNSNKENLEFGNRPQTA